jgi:hypothetical protein
MAEAWASSDLIIWIGNTPWKLYEEIKPNMWAFQVFDMKNDMFCN